MTILIVDDEPTNLKLLRVILEAQDYKVHAVADGIAALEVLEGESVDAIISDILMPRMDGYRLCSEVRSHPRFGKTPFIFYTATYNSPADEKLCYDLGADKYLLKPASAETLLDALNVVTKSSRQHDTSVHHTVTFDEPQVMKQYSEQLVLKLEQKNSELMAAISRLEQSETKFSDAFLWNPAGMTLTDLQSGRLVEVNEKFLNIFEFSRDEVIGRTAMELGIISAEEREKIVRRTQEKGYLPYQIMDARTKTGALRTIQFSSTILDIEGCSYLLMTALDITEGKIAEQKLRSREAELEEAQRIAQIGSWEADLSGMQSVWSAEQFRLLGLEPGSQAFGLNDYLKMIHPDDLSGFRDFVQTSLAKKEPFDIEYRVITTGGETRWLHGRSEVILDDSGNPIRLRGTNQDITGRKISEIALRESELRFRQLAENIREVFYLIDPQMTQIFYISPAYEEIWGRSCQSLYDAPRSWREAIHPEDRQRVYHEGAPNGILTEGKVEYRIIRPNGEIRFIRSQAFPIHDETGKVFRFAGTAEDITKERLVEAQLLQAQKMEAIGQLSGGVAHDFNNLLTVILGHANILAAQQPDGETAESINEIKRAGERAANLTRQLLLFARKQAMQMKDLDLNSVVAETIKMLARILGEDIQLDFRPVHGELPVHADAGMLDQILLNLAVNSRDAMPQGGRLAIETSRAQFDAATAAQSTQVREGAFAIISFTDSGTGIPASVLPKIFEPFFTTKDVDKGTGLGLATVFGILQQHAGWISAYSEEGMGTTFRIYLPLMQKIQQSASEKSASASTEPVGGSETILFVEDEPAIRLMTSKFLSRLGYNLVMAGSGPEAVKLFEQHRDEIQLVFSDLVMPGGMNGVTLGKTLKEKKPDLKVIFSSGYSEMLLAGEVELTEGFNFLAKPFNLGHLAKIIRLRLDAK